MSKNFLILMMLSGLSVVGCSDAVTTGGGTNVTNSIDAYEDSVESTSSGDVGDVLGYTSDMEGPVDGEAAGDLGSDVPPEVPVGTEEEQENAESGGDPTENPGSHSAAYYEFAEWSIPANGQEEGDNR